MKTDVGNYRSLNEDYIGSYEGEKFKLFVVADGMGGHNAGEVASKLAVDTVIDYVKKHSDFESGVGVLRQAILKGNEEIFKMQNKNKELSGMGTTITACLISNFVAYIANVGDSSCFIINSSGIEKVTKDHSLVQQLIDNGSITEEEANTHPNKNIITRALGTNSKVEVDIFEIEINEPIIFVMCTDGLSNDVNKFEIYDIVTKNTFEESCEKLVDLSKLKGSKDNISVIVFKGECKDDRNSTK